jgi:hypothetical protein
MHARNIAIRSSAARRRRAVGRRALGDAGPIVTIELVLVPVFSASNDGSRLWEHASVDPPLDRARVPIAVAGTYRAPVEETPW